MANVEIYTANYCPYCKKAKDLLQRKNVSFKEIDITDDAAGRAEAMQRSGGRKTVPQIFINGESVGGFDDINALDREGKLDKLLAG